MGNKTITKGYTKLEIHNKAVDGNNDRLSFLLTQHEDELYESSGEYTVCTLKSEPSETCIYLQRS